MRPWLLTLFACSAAATALAQQQPPVSSIRVTGDARVTAKPDRVQIDIGVTTRAALSQDAAAQNAREVDAVRAQALREAATRARAEVDVLAAALGVKVLRILSVEESSPRLMPLRVYNGAASRAMAADAAAPTPVEAGTLDITADVTLSVEVGPAAR